MGCVWFSYQLQDRDVCCEAGLRLLTVANLLKPRIREYGTETGRCVCTKRHGRAEDRTSTTRCEIKKGGEERVRSRCVREKQALTRKPMKPNEETSNWGIQTGFDRGDDPTARTGYYISEPPGRHEPRHAGDAERGFGVARAPRTRCQLASYHVRSR